MRFDELAEIRLILLDYARKGWCLRGERRIAYRHHHRKPCEGFASLGRTNRMNSYCQETLLLYKVKFSPHREDETC
jgi:hypothetical protein